MAEESIANRWSAAERLQDGPRRVARSDPRAVSRQRPTRRPEPSV